MVLRARDQVGSLAVTVWSTLDAAAASRLPSHDSPEDTRDVDRVLLRRTQQYLLARRAGKKPNGLLRDAWKRFYETHNPFVLRVVHRSGLRGSDRDDCIQEVWMTIVRRMAESKYNPRRGLFRCWLYRLIRNRVIDFLRQSTASGVARADLEAVACYRSLPPHEALERQETRRLVHEVLRVLERRTSAANCHIIRGMWLRGHTVSAIADELGLAPRQVWYRHRRTKARLKQLFEAQALAPTD